MDHKVQYLVLYFYTVFKLIIECLDLNCILFPADTTVFVSEEILDQLLDTVKV